MYLNTNVRKISDNAFATLEHSINKDWVTMHVVSIDRTNLGIWFNFYNYYSEVLSGKVTIRLYDIQV